MKKRSVKKRSKRSTAKKSRATPRKSLSKSPQKGFDIPAVYGKTRLVLMARDPWWIYAYWEITPQKERETLVRMSSQNAPGVRRILRVYRQNGSQKGAFFDIEIGNFADNWYIDVGAPGEIWVSEIGLCSTDGRFYVLARSNPARTPRYGVSDEIDPEWRLPDEFWNKLFEASGAFLDSKSSFDLVTSGAIE